MNKTITKVFGLFVAVAIAVTASVPAASALTADELLNILISAGLITDANLAKTLAGTTSGSTATSCGPFTSDQTLGSTGAEVVSLQTFLESKGNLVIPAGVSKGYFGNLTKGALASYQATAGITPAVGYFGPITRAHIASTCTTTTTGGTTGGSTGSTGTGITTIGEEGTISVTLNPTPSAGKTVREGGDEEALIGFKVEATNSDVSVQRVKLDLGTSSTIYTKVFSRVYITNEDGDILAEKALNSSTVTKDGSNYTITITGFDFLVKDGDTEVLLVKADLYSSIKITDQGSKTITLPSNGIRAIDGAGIDQYGPSSSVNRSVTVEATLLDSASLKVSTNTDTPVSGTLIASEGSSDDELDKAHVLSLDLKAEDDDILVTDATVTLSNSGAGAGTSTTAYLYMGSTLLGTASFSSNVATFSDIDFTVSEDSTDTIDVKVDINDADALAATFNVSAVSFTAENSEGTSITPSGSAVGESFTVFNQGPMFELVGSPTVSKNTVTNSDTSTTSVAVTFNVKVTAKGGDVMLGTVASTSPAFGTSTTYFNLYKDGAASTFLVASTTGYSTPSTGVSTAGLTNSFSITENNSVTIPVTFTFENRTEAGALLSLGSYAVGIDGIKWVSGGTVVTTSHMAGDTDWQSSGISLP